jgi:hypothetical protein
MFSGSSGIKLADDNLAPEKITLQKISEGAKKEVEGTRV